MSARPGVSVLLGGMLALSAAAHLLAFAALQWVPQRRPARAQIELETVELTPAEPSAPPRLVTTEPPSGSPSAATLARPTRPPRHASPPPKAAPEAPLLATRDPNPTWSVPPAAPSPPPAPPARVEAPANLPASPPGVLPAAALGRKPGSPSGIDDLLQRYYPRRARVQSVAGEVTVRMRVGADGRVSAVQVLRERPSGFDFANACRNMLSQAPPFVPALDRSGRAVASEVTFRCTFDVEY